MKLNEFIKDLKNKYNSVSLKKLASKKHFELYHFSVKNKREQNKIVLVNSKTKEVEKVDNVKKSDIDIIVTRFKKRFKEYLRQIEEVKKHIHKERQKFGAKNLKSYNSKIEKVVKKRNEKLTKKLSDFKFKDEKQKQDMLFMWFVFFLLREHLLDNKIVEVRNNEIFLLSKEPIDKKIAELLNNLGAELVEKGLRDNSVKLDIIREAQNKTYKRVTSRLKNEEMFYIVTAIYMLKIWKLDVKFKKLLVFIDNEIITDYLEYITDYLIKENEEVTINSIKTALYTYEDIYNKVPLKILFKDEFVKKMYKDKK